MFRPLFLSGSLDNTFKKPSTPLGLLSLYRGYTSGIDEIMIRHYEGILHPSLIYTVGANVNIYAKNMSTLNMQ